MRQPEAPFTRSSDPLPRRDHRPTHAEYRISQNEPNPRQDWKRRPAANWLRSCPRLLRAEYTVTPSAQGTCPSFGCGLNWVRFTRPSPCEPDTSNFTLQTAPIGFVPQKVIVSRTSALTYEANSRTDAAGFSCFPLDTSNLKLALPTDRRFLMSICFIHINILPGNMRTSQGGLRPQPRLLLWQRRKDRQARTQDRERGDADSCRKTYLTPSRLPSTCLLIGTPREPHHLLSLLQQRSSAFISGSTHSPSSGGKEKSTADRS